MSENAKDINGRMVVVGKLPATKAIEVQVALVSLCGEALFKASTTKTADQEAVGAAVLSTLASKLDSEVLLKAVNTTLINYVSIDGKKVMNVDEAFADRVEDLWPTMFFALKVNFSRFFQGNLFASMLARVEGLTQSNQQTSTGTSLAP